MVHHTRDFQFWTERIQQLQSRKRTSCNKSKLEIQQISELYDNQVRTVPVKLECYEDIFSGPPRIFDYTQKKIAPEVGETCVFPFEDGYGVRVHHGCRRTEGFEGMGLEGSNYEVKK